MTQKCVLHRDEKTPLKIHRQYIKKKTVIYWL